MELGVRIQLLSILGMIEMDAAESKNIFDFNSLSKLNELKHSFLDSTHPDPHPPVT